MVVGLPYDRTCFHCVRDIEPKFVTDILNRLRPSYHKKPPVDPTTYKDPDPRALATDARHLSKYIFPSEYGLSSVFLLAANWKGAFQQPTYCNREQEIKVNRLLSYV
jgi:hypothetical protein